MTASVVEFLSQQIDGEFTLRTQRNLHEVFLFPEEGAHFDSVDVKWHVDKTFTVALLMIEPFQLLFIKAEIGRFVLLKNL